MKLLRIILIIGNKSFKYQQVKRLLLLLSIILFSAIKVVGNVYKCDTIVIYDNVCIIKIPQETTLSIDNYEEGVFYNYYSLVDSVHITVFCGYLTKLPLKDLNKSNVYYKIKDNGLISKITGYEIVGKTRKYFIEVLYKSHMISVLFENIRRDNLKKYKKLSKCIKLSNKFTHDGQKLRTKYQTATGNVVVPLNTVQTITAATTTQTDYVGNLVYTATASGSTATPVLNKILYPDGYFMVSSGTGGDFRYFVKDHLGNNRVVNNGSTVYQRTHYYPFGGPYADVGTASDYQPYKYNGKELDRMHGLDLYDYGFRHYDPIVPMFTQQDPMAEK